MLGQALGERAAALDGQGEFAQDFLQRWVAFLLLQHEQPAQQGQASVHQRGQLTGEGAEGLGVNAPAQAGDLDVDLQGSALGLALAARSSLAGCVLAVLLVLVLAVFALAVLALVGLDHLGWEKAHLLEAAEGLVLVGDVRQGALDGLALGIHRFVGEDRHKVPPVSDGSGVADYLFNRGAAVKDQAQAVVANGSHP